MSCVLSPFLAMALFLSHPSHSSRSSQPDALEPLTIDFGRPHETRWRTLNDGVMGGRSIGTVEYGREAMTWAGKVSLENNGGFSSVRSPWGRSDYSAYGSVTLRCRTTTGTPDTFTWTMEVSERWWMPYWKAEFSAGPEWSEVTIPFAALKKSSAYTGELPEFWTWGNLSAVLRTGFMKYDGTAGDFGLEVDWLRFNAGEPVKKQD